MKISIFCPQKTRVMHLDWINFFLIKITDIIIIVIIIIYYTLFQQDNIFGTSASLIYGPRLQR